MVKPSIQIVRWASWVGLSLAVACTKPAPPPIPLTLSLYGGISRVARMGDPEFQVLSNPLWHAKKENVSDTDLRQLQILEKTTLPTIGVTIYFRRRQVVLIEIHEPFAGTVEGFTIKAFGQPTPAGMGWEQALIKRFGFPSVRAAGGKFGSQALYYSWGDVVYDKVGPIEYAIYQAPDVANYRQNNFGKHIQLFNNN